ncbi:hypothetical protein T4A_13556 [Trichinella pseudospiralis]|uniref:Uncharacterized protein n=1 Tax=Trichinella pseudospiralis TaxID=6337 RepID=A0A0V1E0H3_TRIPS|nr:hypothetical protein T4A_13556 [Trichinella pseudospiralis]
MLRFVDCAFDVSEEVQWSYGTFPKYFFHIHEFAPDFKQFDDERYVMAVNFYISSSSFYLFQS